MNVEYPRCEKCREQAAVSRVEVESPRENRTADMDLCDECIEIADGLGCYVETILVYLGPKYQSR